MQEVQPAVRDSRLVRIILVLAAVALFFIVLGQAATFLSFFSDILLTFFLAWLLAFIISPIVSRIVGIVPRLPRALATVIVYTAVVIVLVLVIVLVAGALATSIGEFVAKIPQIEQDLPAILKPWQDWLTSVGLGQIDLVTQAAAILANLDDVAGVLVQPLQQIAVASVSVIGTMLIVFFLSIYMVVDRDQIMAFLFRIVPPSYAEEARLLQTSVSRSFGGFLRGQGLMGVIYFFVALVTNVLMGLPLVALTSTASGILQSIPFFGPFLSWAPPVIVALLFKPEVVVPTFILMMIGWVVVMNVLQPRIMQGAVGIHPVVVLGSVLIGSRIAGVPGAIFGIPIAAVVSAFFFNFLHRTTGDRSVTGRAARRLSERDGRPVHVPREPTPGSAEDIEEDADDADDVAADDVAAGDVAAEAPSQETPP
jgi:predicted PurR-regulated permease PerM